MSAAKERAPIDTPATALAASRRTEFPTLAMWREKREARAREEGERAPAPPPSPLATIRPAPGTASAAVERALQNRRQPAPEARAAGLDEAAAFERLEARLTEMFDKRLGAFNERIEQLLRDHAEAAAPTDLAAAVQRDLAELKLLQAASDLRTQAILETVRDALGEMSQRLPKRPLPARAAPVTARAEAEIERQPESRETGRRTASPEGARAKAPGIVPPPANDLRGPRAAPEPRSGGRSRLWAAAGAIALLLIGAVAYLTLRDAPGAKSPARVAAPPSAAVIEAPARIAGTDESPEILYDTAERAIEGRGVLRDAARAANLFEKAAQAGYAPAQYRLAIQHEKGMGVTRDLARARDLYRAAAEKGHARAAHNLGVLAAEGAGDKPDFAAAATWFRKGAEFGLRDSQYNLAVILTRGVGVPADPAGAYRWFAIAAAQGDADAGRQRDEIGAKLTPEELAAARAAAAAFKPNMPDPAVNRGSPQS